MGTNAVDYGADSATPTAAKAFAKPLANAVDRWVAPFTPAGLNPALRILLLAGASLLVIGLLRLIINEIWLLIAAPLVVVAGIVVYAHVRRRRGKPAASPDPATHPESQLADASESQSASHIESRSADRIDSG